jgi:prepilin-type processing-associated H-X9-DG protein
MLCLACRREYPQGARYCAVCGAELAARPQEADEGGAACAEPAASASGVSAGAEGRSRAAVKAWVPVVVAIVFVGGLVVLGAVVPRVTKARAARRAARHEAECREHLVRLGMALAMYVSDYDGRLPLKENWGDGLMPYVKDKGAFRCPDGGYAYNSALSGAIRVSLGGAAAALGAGKGCVEWSGNGHSYQLFEANVNWTDAKAGAEALGGYLMTIASGDEEEFLRGGSVAQAMAEGRGYTWIGLYQDPANGPPDANWHWVTGEGLNYTNWSPNEPNEFSPGEDYGEMMGDTGSWNDVTNEGGVMGAGHLHNVIVEWDGPVFAAGTEGSLPVIFDAAGGWNASGARETAAERHHGGANVVFADGHVAWMGSAELDAAVWSPPQGVPGVEGAPNGGSSDAQPTAKPKHEGWGHVPLLCGSSRAEIEKRFGDPQNTNDNPTYPTWYYSKGGEQLSISWGIVREDRLLPYPGEDKEVKYPWVVESVGYTPPAGVTLREIIPEKLAERAPDYRIVGHSENAPPSQFEVSWVSGEAQVSVTCQTDYRATGEQRYYDRDSGVHQTRHFVTNDLLKRWLDGRVVKYEQVRACGGWGHKLEVGFSYGVNRGWEIYY